MIIRRNRFQRWIATILLGLGCSVSPSFCPSVHAQPPPDAAADSGRPLDGYLATLTLMLLAMYLVGKSARR